MVARRWFPAFIAVALTLGVCCVAHANSLSPYVFFVFWPGIIPNALIYAFPASLLAAFLERPFFTIAGIKKRPLVLSLRANFASTIAGILLIPIGYPAIRTIGLLWCVLLFGVSCAVEISYLRRYSYQSFAWRWVVGGNAFSSVVLLLLPYVAFEFHQTNYPFSSSLEPHVSWIAFSSMAVSVVLFLGSFGWHIFADAQTAPSLRSSVHRSQIRDPTN